MDESYSEGISIAELFGIVKNHCVLLLVVFIGVVALSVGYALICTPTYTATTTILVERIDNLVDTTVPSTAIVVNTAATDAESRNIENEMQYLNSSIVVTKALLSMDLGAYTHKDGTDYSDLLLDENKFNNLVSNIGISQIKNSNLVTVSFEHTNLTFSKDFLSALYSMFAITLSELTTDQLDREQQILEIRLDEAEDVLASELTLQGFQSTYNSEVNAKISVYQSEVIKFISQLKAIKSFKSIGIDPVTVIEPVQIVDLDGNSNTLLVLAVGLLMGLALGFLAVLLYDSVSDSLIDEYGIKKLVGDQIPIWSTIPKIKKNNNHSSSELGIYTVPESRVAESFDQLAGIVQHKGTSGENVYCFSSLGYGESGVSTVLNLALSIMKNGKKVLVVGTNSEETKYHDLYNPIIVSDPSVKIGSFEKMDLDAVRNTNTTLPLLHLVSVDGKLQEVPIFLNSEVFAATVRSASEVYDVVLIDGPTFRSPSALLAVAKNSAGIVLNIRQGIASKRAMKQLLVTVSFSQVPILGLVLNTMFGRPSLREKHRIQEQAKNIGLPLAKMCLPFRDNKNKARWASG